MSVGLLLQTQKDPASFYWERVLAPAQEQNEGYLSRWFTTRDGFEGCCVVDRGQGSCRLLELRSHTGYLRIPRVEDVTRIQKPPLPEKVELPTWLGEPEVGDTVTWDNCPSWWNPNGERLSRISGGYGWVDYWRSPIVYERLRVVIKLHL